MLGLRPGVGMLGDNLDVTLSMVWQIAIAYVLATVLLFAVAKHLTKIAFIPSHVLIPGVLLFIYMGGWLGSTSIGDWISCTFFGLVGFLMQRGGWPRPPVILALVLGGLLEGSFQISMRIHQGFGWLSRPIVVVIGVIIIASVFFGWRRIRQQNKSVSETAREEALNPALSLPLAVILAAVFIWAGVSSLDWPRSVKQLPLLVAVVGAVFSLVVVLQDSRHLLIAKHKLGSWASTFSAGWKHGMMPDGMRFLAYLVGMVLLTLLVGQKIALPLTMMVYLRHSGGKSLLFSIVYGLIGWLIIVTFYDYILGITFHPSWLGQQLQTVIPVEWSKWFIN
jgi:hypothetical protein